MRVLDHSTLAQIAAGADVGFHLLDLVERYNLPVLIPASALEQVARDAFSDPDAVTLLGRIDATLGFNQVNVDVLDEHRALQVAEAGSRIGQTAGSVSYAHAAVCAREHDCVVITADGAVWKDLAPDVVTVELTD
ncbi:hypothetical protein SMC26_42215 [Actinomadura fulvescens]|uniref:PIN domain-containing protein n=1 Tax=Actinomadura fulvescens TaxID=46160 RepID=A0ABP6DEI0_9ACTN